MRDYFAAAAPFEYPHSLGFLWEKMSKYLGFSEYDACKTMSLAAYGSADIYAEHPDFRARYESCRAGLTDYLVTAIRAFADRELA